jgi:hypothetical protein
VVAPEVQAVVELALESKEVLDVLLPEEANSAFVVLDV